MLQTRKGGTWTPRPLRPSTSCRGAFARRGKGKCEPRLARIVCRRRDDVAHHVGDSSFEVSHEIVSHACFPLSHRLAIASLSIHRMIEHDSMVKRELPLEGNRLPPYHRSPERKTTPFASKSNSPSAGRARVRHLPQRQDRVRRYATTCKHSDDDPKDDVGGPRR